MRRSPDHEPNESDQLRTLLDGDQRTAEIAYGIDPGFVHYRLIESIVGDRVMEFIHQQIREVPDSTPSWLRATHIGHIYTRTLVAFCEANEVPRLGALCAARRGRLFCSTERLAPTPDLYDQERVVTRVEKPELDNLSVELHYSTGHLSADTVKHYLHEGGHDMSLVALLQPGPLTNTLAFEPLVIGSPVLASTTPEPPFDGMEWWSLAYGEVYAEDIDTLSKVADHDLPADFSVMEHVSENAFKQCLAELLVEDPGKDWGGEQSDLFTSHIVLRGRRTSGAFLLKGPAKFSPMTVKHLGKNGDQIYRLAQEPAELLVVQHSHEITPAVRAMLRAFAIGPGRLRQRYCLIDGRDSLRILQAYDKLDRALELSAKS